MHEYITCYAKNIANFKAGEESKNDDSYKIFDQDKQRYYKTQLLRKWGSNSKRENRPNLFYPIKTPDDTDLYPMISDNEEGCWRWGKNTMNKAIEEGRVEFKKTAR